MFLILIKNVITNYLPTSKKPYQQWQDSGSDSESGALLVSVCDSLSFNFTSWSFLVFVSLCFFLFFFFLCLFGPDFSPSESEDWVSEEPYSGFFSRPHQRRSFCFCFWGSPLCSSQSDDWLVSDAVSLVSSFFLSRFPFFFFRLSFVLSLLSSPFCFLLALVLLWHFFAAIKIRSNYCA